MGLDQIANIAEISAAILVVASLIYVGLQLRQNTQSMRLETVQAIVAEWNSWYDMITPDKELIGVYHRGVMNPESLNNIEKMQFTFLTTRIFRTFNEQYFMWREGMMDEMIWNSWVAQFNDAMKTPGWQTAWAERRHWYDENYQSFIDSCIVATKNVRPMYDSPDVNDPTIQSPSAKSD